MPQNSKWLKLNLIKSKQGGLAIKCQEHCFPVAWSHTTVGGGGCSILPKNNSVVGLLFDIVI